jgi:NADH-ubiquinone oxidoreductase chain 5
MEGPTPVSALLHAATMVTAGVFLIIRCAPLFECTPRILVAIALIGGFTTFIMSFIAVCQYDIKKVIAYSTCSQLGYMFFVCGYSQYHVALFHLYNHAFFKALLFLGAGLIIHACSDEQDMRYYGGFLNFLPFSYICLFIGSLAIIGFPFLTGFYSKELILEIGSCRYLIDALFIYFLAVLGAINTTIYSWRILIFVFFGPTNANSFALTENNK